MKLRQKRFLDQISLSSSSLCYYRL